MPVVLPDHNGPQSNHIDPQPQHAKYPRWHVDEPEIVRREEWGAVPWTSEEHNIQPVNHLRLQYTGGRECNNREDCVKLLQELQRTHMEENHLPDIMFNFLLSTDGTIYEGRGFNRCAFRADKHHVILKQDMVNIAFIGKFKDKPLPLRAERAGINLTEWAKFKNYMVKDVIIYGIKCGNIDWTYW